jgi:hypothetical protein
MPWDYSIPILRDIPVAWMRMFRWQNVLKSLDDICSGCRDGYALWFLVVLLFRVEEEERAYRKSI